MVSTAAIDILSSLATRDGNRYLFGQRFDDAPLSLVAESGSMLPVDRNLAEELVIGGFVEDEAQRGESINVVFRITEKGRTFLASMDQ
jgi:hypothetical protein